MIKFCEECGKDAEADGTQTHYADCSKHPTNIALRKRHDSSVPEQGDTTYIAPQHSNSAPVVIVNTNKLAGAKLELSYSVLKGIVEAYYGVPVKEAKYKKGGLVVVFEG